jgi:hypothetical protein
MQPNLPHAEGEVASVKLKLKWVDKINTSLNTAIFIRQIHLSKWAALSFDLN